MKKNQTKTKPPEHYVDNDEFLRALTEYRRELLDAAEKGLDRPVIPTYIGECIIQIATNLSMKHNFVGYTFRDEMVLDAIENCVAYIGNFDPDKSTYAFTYFSQICFWAFVRRIKKEKKYTDFKQRYAEQLLQQMPTDLAEALSTAMMNLESSSESQTPDSMIRRPKYLNSTIDPTDNE